MMGSAEGGSDRSVGLVGRRGAGSVTGRLGVEGCSDGSVYARLRVRARLRGGQWPARQALCSFQRSQSGKGGVMNEDQIRDQGSAVRRPGARVGRVWVRVQV